MKAKSIINVFISVVWLINGLLCKVLNLVPRHQQIVSEILGDQYGFLLTKIIGLLEIVMFVWVVSGIKSRWCALTQITVVVSMNVIEFFVVPDLLLFGKLNALFAFLFVGLIYFNEFGMKKTNNARL
jgi:uncharacterized membrane protein YphA (DoxX/SURF4 family)